MNRFIFSPRLWSLGLLFCCLGFSSCAQKVTVFNQALSDVEILSADSMAGRLPNTLGHAKAQAYILKRFKESGLLPVDGQYQHPFTFTLRGGKTPMTGVNLLGVIPGTSAKTIVITAHYDHVGTNNGKIFNGADDNASGVGAILAIAAHFKKEKPAHTLLFVAFDAEEQGLAGSKAFVANPPVPLANMVLNVNLDMVSISNKNELYAAGTFHNPWLRDALANISVPAGITLSFGHDRPEQGQNDWTKQSDHGSFYAKQIPFLYFGVEDHPHYHKETDEFRNINQAFYLKAVDTILNAVQTLDKELPL